MYELKSKQGKHLTSLNLRNDSVVLWTNEINDDKFSAIPLLARGQWLFCRFPEKPAFLTFCHWPRMTIWPQLCSSHMREVPNPEEQLWLVDTVIFSWIKTTALQEETFSNNSANAYFHLQTSGFPSPFHIPFSKADCFLTTSNTPSDAFLISQQNFWLLWCPLICHGSHSMTHHKERLPSCFKPASPSSQPQAIPQLQGASNTLTRVTRLLQGFCKATTYT